MARVRVLLAGILLAFAVATCNGTPAEVYLPEGYTEDNSLQYNEDESLSTGNDLVNHLTNKVLEKDGDDEDDEDEDDEDEDEDLKNIQIMTEEVSKDLSSKSKSGFGSNNMGSAYGAYNVMVTPSSSTTSMVTVNGPQGMHEVLQVPSTVATDVINFNNRMMIGNWLYCPAAGQLVMMTGNRCTLRTYYHGQGQSQELDRKACRNYRMDMFLLREEAGEMAEGFSHSMANAFGQSFPHGSNQFGSSNNPFGSSNNPFGSSNNPFGSGDFFGSNGGMFGTNPYHHGSSSNTFGSHNPQYGPPNSQFGPSNMQSYGANTPYSPSFAYPPNPYAANPSLNGYPSNYAIPYPANSAYPSAGFSDPAMPYSAGGYPNAAVPYPSNAYSGNSQYSNLPTGYPNTGVTSPYGNTKPPKVDQAYGNPAAMSSGYGVPSNAMAYGQMKMPVEGSNKPAKQAAAPFANTGAPFANTGAPFANTGAPLTNTGAPYTNTEAVNPASSSGSGKANAAINNLNSWAQ